jgi:hypothetical protein
MTTTPERVVTLHDSNTNTAIGPSETVDTEKTPENASPFVTEGKKRKRKKKRYVFHPPTGCAPPPRAPDPDVLPALAVGRDGKVESRPLYYTTVYEERFTRVYDFFSWALVTILSAIWGSGKTYAFVEYVVQCIRDDKLPQFILVITPRISLAIEDVARFNLAIDAAIAAIPPEQALRRARACQYRFVSYLEAETPAHAIDVNHRAVICSLQSLYKLRWSPFYQHHVHEGRGRVFIDESEELAKSLSTNETTGSHLREDAMTLADLCGSPYTHTMLCDAWPQESTSVLARLLTRGNDNNVACVRNATTPPQRDVIAYDSIGALCSRIVKDITDDRAACAGKPPIVVEHDGRTYSYTRHKFVVASDNRAQAKKIAAVLRRLGLRVKLYTSEATIIEKAYLQDDVLAPACDVFIFSPAITVGVDFSMHGLFARVYAVITFQGCPMRSVMQMLHRPRHPIDTSIACYIGRKKDVFFSRPVTPGENLLDLSNPLHEDELMKIDEETMRRAIARYERKARAGKRSCNLLGNGADKFASAPPFLQYLIMLDVTAQLELELQKKGPRPALFRTLRYANMRLLRTEEHCLLPKQARNFARLHRFPDEVRQPRIETADPAKADLFRKMFVASNHFPGILRMTVFREFMRDRHGRLGTVAACLAAFFATGLKPILKELRVVNGAVEPLVYGFENEKYNIVWHIIAILGMPVCAPAYLLDNTSFSVTVDEATEAQLAAFLKDRHLLFSVEERGGQRHVLPERSFPVPTSRASAFSVVTGPAASSSTTTSAVDGAARQPPVVDNDDDSSDDDDGQSKYCIIGTAHENYHDSSSSSSSDDDDADAKDDASAEDGDGSGERPIKEHTTRTSVGPVTPPETRPNPFYWTELALNLLYSYTNTVGSLKRLRNRTRPGAAARIVFTNELPKATDCDIAEFLCRERTGKSPNYDDAVFLIKPASPDEALYERLRRVLANPKVIDDEETFKNIFGMTRAEVREEGQRRGLYDIHKRYSWLDVVNTGAITQKAMQLLTTNNENAGDVIQEMKQLAKEAAQSKAEKEQWRQAAADRDAVIERTSAQLEEAAEHVRAAAERQARADAEIARLRSELQRKRSSEDGEDVDEPRKRHKPNTPDQNRPRGLSADVKRRVVDCLKKYNFPAGTRIDYGLLEEAAGVSRADRKKLMKFVDNWRNNR